MKLKMITLGQRIVTGLVQC